MNFIFGIAEEIQKKLNYFYNTKILCKLYYNIFPYMRYLFLKCLNDLINSNEKKMHFVIMNLLY